MNIEILNTPRYAKFVKGVYKDDELIGCIIPITNDLIFSGSDCIDYDAKIFKDDNPGLATVIRIINNYRRSFGYKRLYIDRHNSGIANLRNNQFWFNLGFKQDSNPALLYLSDYDF